MSKVLICGVGSTTFGDHSKQSMRSLSVKAADQAIAESGVFIGDIDKIFHGNAGGGIVTQQEMIRGQIAFRGSELAGVPLINIENACASGGSAVHLAYEAIRAGQVEVALVVGVEKLKHEDKGRAFRALHGSIDVIEFGECDPNEDRSYSILMDLYAGLAQEYLDTHNALPEDFARIAVKNRNNAVHNPLAQYRRSQTVEEVINSRMIVSPMTLPMCAPLTDGAVAIILCSENYAKRLNVPKVSLDACVLACTPDGASSPVRIAAKKIYEQVGHGIEDFDFAELHDASAPAELFQYEEIGLCNEGEAPRLVREGYTEISGVFPVNTSGGLLSRGHALGATGCAQIAEVVCQLTGAGGGRQLSKARRGVAFNGGGWIGKTYALTVASALSRHSG